MRPQCPASDSTLTTNSFRHPDFRQEVLFGPYQSDIPGAASLHSAGTASKELFWSHESQARQLLYIYLRPPTLSLHQVCFRCYASLLLSCEVMIRCFLPSTPVCQGILWHRRQTTFRDNRCKQCTERQVLQCAISHLATTQQRGIRVFAA